MHARPRRPRAERAVGRMARPAGGRAPAAHGEPPAVDRTFCSRARAPCSTASAASSRTSSTVRIPSRAGRPERARRSEATRPLGVRPRPRHFAPPPLLFENGFGGFTTDGREYVIVLPGDAVLPRPWSNVLANPEFGQPGHARRSRVHLGREQPRERLTPFANDPVTDLGAEAFYLRDSRPARRWARPPTRWRASSMAARIVRHGFGVPATARARQPRHELAVFVAPDDPVKALGPNDHQPRRRAAPPARVRLLRMEPRPPRPEMASHV
jgi:hypothetical protein